MDLNTDDKVIGKKNVEKLENGTYKVEFWHNEIAFERSIYPNENIIDYTPLERKIYENVKLYSEEYFRYEKNEKVKTVYNESGKKSLKVTTNSQGIIQDNYFKEFDKVEKREYLENNTFELKKEEIFNLDGKLIEIANWNEGELLSSKKYWENGSQREENYYENGKLERSIKYENDDRISIKYDENGNIKSQEIYKKVGEIGNAKITVDGIGYQQSLEKEYYKNGNIKKEIQYKPFTNTYFSEVGIIHRDEVLPIKEKNYNNSGEIINEKINEYHREYDEFTLKKSTEIDYSSGKKVREIIKEYDDFEKIIDEKVNNFENKKTALDIVKEDRGRLVDLIVKNLEEKGEGWLKEWNSMLSPQNGINGIVYRGGNRVKLGAIALENGFNDPRWATERQIKEKGWEIEKGAKFVICEHWKFTKTIEVLNKDTKEKEKKEKEI